MARQMIFTSTPQGLEPGRTGFCTVARHRSLRSRLVRELERISVYEFNLGENVAKAKINSFRRFELGTEEFYVLTRIRDSGLDYTNRTNYIAHHLIFDGLEIAVSPSPAEIFLQWTGWLDVWEGSSRWFEDGEITDVSSCKMNGLCPAQNWQSVTGDGGNAAYLVAEKAKRPILLEVMQGQEEGLLQMFAESCALLPMPMEAWQFAFTTYLQDTDDAKAFAWIGGRGQPSAERIKQKGASNHLNFTAFDQRSIRDPMDEKLVLVAREGRKAKIKQKPPLEEIGVGSAAGGEVPSGSTRISFGRDGGGFSSAEREQFKQAAASHAAAQATVTTQGGDEGSKKRKKRPKWPWIAALAAVLLLGIFVALKSGVLDGIFGKEPNGGSVAQNPKGDGSKKTEDPLTPDPVDPPPDGPDPEVIPPVSPTGIQPDVPSLAKVKDIHPDFEYIVWQVGDAEPVKINLEGISYALGKKLDQLKIGDEMDVTFQKGATPGTFVIASLVPPKVRVVIPPDITSPNLSQTPEKKEFTAEDYQLIDENFMVLFTSQQGVQLRYVFPPDKRARFAELVEYKAAGRKIDFLWDGEGGNVRAFDFNVKKITGPIVTNQATAPPSFPLTESYVLWLTQYEVDELDQPDPVTTSVENEVVFVQNLKKKLDRMANSGEKAFVWEANYNGPQDFVEPSAMEGSVPYRVTHKKVFDFERYSLETAEDGTSALLFRFLFEPPDKVTITMENKMARQHAKRGIILRLPDLMTRRAMNLYFLNPKVTGSMEVGQGAKPNVLDKANLALVDDKVTVAKKGAFEHGLQVVGSSGPYALRLSVDSSEGMFYGPSLSVSDFMSGKLVRFPELWVKPVVGDPLTCDMKLFIDYATKLDAQFDKEILALNQAIAASKKDMPDPVVFENLEKFGTRVKYPEGNYVSGSGPYGVFLNKVVIDFFERVHGFEKPASDKLKEELFKILPDRLFKGDFEYRDYWKTVRDRVVEEVNRPFPLAVKQYDPSKGPFSKDIDKVYESLRFLYESQRAFARSKDDQRLFFESIRQAGTTPVRFLYDIQKKHAQNAMVMNALPKYHKVRGEFENKVSKALIPSSLNRDSLIKALECIENLNAAMDFKKFKMSGDDQPKLDALNILKTKLAQEIRELSDGRIKLQTEQKAATIKQLFEKERWSLRLFRKDQIKSDAELVRFE